MTTTIPIQAIPRPPGKSTARKLRAKRLIPSIVYGPQIPNICFAIRELDASRYSAKKFDNSIFILQSEDKKLHGISVLKKNLTLHPIHGRPVHLDFYALNMSQTVKVRVEIKYQGKSLGERNGGIFQPLRRDVEVECLPTTIPHTLTVDITDMNLGDVLHASTLSIPEDVKLITSKKEAIASIVTARTDTTTSSETENQETQATDTPDEKKKEAKT